MIRDPGGQRAVGRVGQLRRLLGLLKKIGEQGRMSKHAGFLRSWLQLLDALRMYRVSVGQRSRSTAPGSSAGSSSSSIAATLAVALTTRRCSSCQTGGKSVGVGTGVDSSKTTSGSSVKTDSHRGSDPEIAAANS